MPKRAQSFLTAITLICLTIVSVSPRSVHAGSPSPQPAPPNTLNIFPRNVSISLQPGQNYSFEVKIDTPSVPIPKIDVLFLFDITNSMAEEIEQAKTHGNHIMQTLRSTIPDSWFGLATVCDYPGYFTSPDYSAQYGATDDMPWELVHDISEDLDAVTLDIQGLALCHGEDQPEAYARALFETLYSVSWRPGAKHIVVLFGDAPAHGPDFYLPYGGDNFGIDPGVDEVIGTDDDLRLGEVIKQVRNRGIVLMPVSSATSPATNAGFQFMADETGGKFYPLEKADELASTVLEGLGQSISVISNLSVHVPFEYAHWVSFFPGSFESVGGGEHLTLNVSIKVSDGVPPSEYQFPIQLIGDGAQLGEILVSITVLTVSEAYKLPSAEELFKRKLELIRQLSHPSYPIEVWSMPTVIELDKSYAEAEQPVHEWVKSLRGSELDTETFVTFFALVQYEHLLERALYVTVKASNIVGKEIAYCIGPALSLISAWRVMRTLSTKQPVGKLITKLDYYILAKIVSLLGIFLEWTFSVLPPTERTALAPISKNIIDTYSTYIENALKTRTRTSDMLSRLLIQITAQLIVPIITQFFGSEYVRSTQPSLGTALTVAKEAGNFSRKEDGTSAAQVTNIDVGVRQFLDGVYQEVDTYSNTQVRLETTHRKLEAISELTALVGMLLTISGVGAAIGIIGQAISMALNLIGLAMSTDFVIRCVGFISELDDRVVGEGIKSAFPNAFSSSTMLSAGFIPAAFTGTSAYNP